MKLFLLLTFLSVKAYSETQVYEGMAKHEGQLMYVERHTVVSDAQAIIKSETEYLDPTGKLIGTMKSNFTHSLAAPEYEFQDIRYHRRQGLKWINNNPEIYSQEDHRGPVSKRFEKGEQLQVAGPGLVYFIGTNLRSIISKKTLEFQYVIPGRMEAFDFYVKPIAHNQQVAEFEVEMKPWLMRIFGPRIKLIYDIPKKRLIFFKGLSNLRDGEGKMMSVEIEYRYYD